MTNAETPLRALVSAAFLLLLTGCATAPPAPRDAGASATGEQVARIARAMRGHPYRWGGDTPDGFDCSGLVEYAYERAGIQVPRTVRGQYQAVQRLYLRQIEPGDLVFFRTGGAFASHVGIYIGHDRFVHAPKSQSTVRVSSLDQRYWRQRLVRVGRFTR